MCSPASFETAYVHRASPTEPIVVTWPSCTLKACWPNTSLVENSTSRSSVSRVASGGLEHVVGADHVDPHRPHGALEDGVDPGDPGGMDDVRAPRDELGQRAEVEHVALDEAEARMRLERGPSRERVAVEVVDRDDLVRVDEPARERRADEAGAARDQHALARQRHAGMVDGRLRRTADGVTDRVSGGDVDRASDARRCSSSAALWRSWRPSPSARAATALTITYYDDSDRRGRARSLDASLRPGRRAPTRVASPRAASSAGSAGAHSGRRRPRWRARRSTAARRSRSSAGAVDGGGSGHA